MRLLPRSGIAASLALLLATTATHAAAPVIPPGPTDAPAVHPPAGAPDSFADLAARLLPAVVNVSTSETVKPGSDDDDDDDDQGGPQVPNFPPGSPFEKFFHDFMNRQNAPDAPPRKMQALGSGFIIDATGYIVTNNHVIKNADQITVTLQDNTVLKARLVGHDDRTDLAILKVEAPHPLPTVGFGDSDHARVGDWVLAIGNPFGLAGTVTAGIVSSRGRNIDAGPYDDFIQTDAPINKGNSGGPLFNMRGEVIGINTAIYSPSGGSIGIGFSIPSNEARGILEQLRTKGKVSHGWIGVHIQDVTQDIADGLGLKVAHGALVAEAQAKGPAAVAGLKTGDVIQTLNGKDVEGRALPRLVSQLPIGQDATFGVWRHGKTLNVTVKIGTLPDDSTDQAETPEPKKKPAAHGSIDLHALGFTAATLDDVARQKYNLPTDQRGVLVSAVADNGAASDRGLKPGDVITEVSQVAVATPEDLQHRIEDARHTHRHSVLFLVQGSDGLRWVPFPLDDAK